MASVGVDWTCPSIHARKILNHCDWPWRFFPSTSNLNEIHPANHLIRLSDLGADNYLSATVVSYKKKDCGGSHFKPFSTHTK